MAAPEITIFFPAAIEKQIILQSIVVGMSLSVDEVREGLSFEFSAQRTTAGGYIAVEYDPDASSIIEELSQWEKPTAEYKQLLACCQSSLTIRYRGLAHAKECLRIVGAKTGQLSSKCILENGLGCLLRLSEVTQFLADDASWTWEKQAFPELGGVAPSEWIETTTLEPRGD